MAATPARPAGRRSAPLTQASVLGQGAACCPLQVPGDPLHGGFSPQHGRLTGAFLLPHQGPACGLASQGARHLSLSLVLLERDPPRGPLCPGWGLHSVLAVGRWHLPPESGPGQAGAWLLAGGGQGEAGQGAPLRGGVGALRGRRGAHVVQLREKALAREVFEDVPRLHRVTVIQVLGWTLGRLLWNRGALRGGLGRLSPF